jgi:hypothetical protein
LKSSSARSPTATSTCAAARAADLKRRHGSASAAVIGWLYTIVCSAALLIGAYIVAGLHQQGEATRRRLMSRPLLELFCWVLIALTLLSAFTRVRGEEAIRVLAGASR